MPERQVGTSIDWERRDEALRESRAAFVGGSRFASTLPHVGKAFCVQAANREGRAEPVHEELALHLRVPAVELENTVRKYGREQLVRSRAPDTSTMHNADLLMGEFDRITAVSTRSSRECFQTQGRGAPF